MLAPHIHAAVLGNRTVLLDVTADRYRMLRGPSARAIADLVGGRPIADGPVRAALLCAGIIGEVAGPERATLPDVPGRGVAAMGNAFGAPLFATARALLAARLTLRRQGFARALARAESNKADSVLAPDDMAAAARADRFERARRLLPFRKACLPDSLALFSWLIADRIDATLVIGVRLDPFLAHCWVQTDEILLTDDPDAVAAYTPLLAI